MTDPEKASPLITYTNAVRDAHNYQCAKAFAVYTKQEYYEYHAVDTVNRGKTELRNLAAESAWQTPIKQAHDLGLSNGGFGRLISAKYVVRNGRRYASSAVIDIEQYNGGSEENPHRLTIVPVKCRFCYHLPGLEKAYWATRSQLPIIPAFAFTSHNSQSRSLSTACIDLESCRSIASAYVMLSRLKSLDGLSILRPFSLGKIQRHAPQQMRNEVARLDTLFELTKTKSKDDLKWYYDWVQS